MIFVIQNFINRKAREVLITSGRKDFQVFGS
jgi:hypothetical protein